MNSDMRDVGGTILGIGDHVCLAREIKGVSPGELIGKVVELHPGERENVSVEVLEYGGGSPMVVRIQARELKRLNTLLKAAAERLSQDVREMQSGEVPAYEPPEGK